MHTQNNILETDRSTQFAIHNRYKSRRNQRQWIPPCTMIALIKRTLLLVNTFCKPTSKLSLTLHTATSKVCYPELPKLSPTKRHLHSRNNNASPPKKQQIYVEPGTIGPHSSTFTSPGIFRSPPNTGRRRAPKLASTLAKSPPRPSYADKVKGIFSESTPMSRPGFRNLEHKKTESGHGEMALFSVGSHTSSSSLTSESELEKRLGTTQVVPDPRSIQAIRPNQVVKYQPFKSPGHSGGTPIIPRIQEPAPEQSSSDEWTGDEEFIPRSARRRNRILQQQQRKYAQDSTMNSSGIPISPERLKVAAAINACGTPIGTQTLQVAAERSREVRSLLQSYPLSPKASRFMPAVPAYVQYHKSTMLAWRCEPGGNRGSIARSPAKRAEEATDHRASDADDEEDSDPDR